MSKTDTPKREIERHVIRSIRKLADSDLIRLLEQLRRLSAQEATRA